MAIGISDLAYSIRSSSAATAVPVSLGHAHQLIAAALGYRTLASYQAAFRGEQELSDLAAAQHVVLDIDMLRQRADELGITHSLELLHELVKTAFEKRAPDTRLHHSYGGFEDYIREHIDQVVINDADVNSEMANANYDGIDEIYLEIDVEFDEVSIGAPLSIELDGHVSLGIDLERPYAGHKVNVKGFVNLERMGRHCFTTVECEVTHAKLDYGWSSDEGQDEPPLRSISEAYADLLGLELHEVGDLVDVEPIARDGNTGEMVYSYLLDFTEHASPEIAQKILQRHSSLCIEVWPNFFENIRDDDWPR